jgi:hypothetical protein
MPSHVQPNPTADDDIVVAEAGDEHLHVTIRGAAPLTLQGDTAWRTDGNSPVRITNDGATVFFSVYEPIGHNVLRRGSQDLCFTGKAIPVHLLSDPDARVGKWIEALWQQPEGPLHGWLHVEEPAPCSAPLVVPHIARAVSDDGGFMWEYRGEVLRAPRHQIDCSWQNGFFAGGYGDLCVVPDRSARLLYMFFSSYHTDESAQGIAVARMPAAGGPGAGDVAWWSHGGWRPIGEGSPKPPWPMSRGWRHPDPDGFWGPAVHYNRALDAYVMLLNRTAGGAGDFVQEGIYASVNRTLDNPEGWSPPLQIVRGGTWYPQAIGLEEGCGNTETGAIARLFMAGFSIWTIEFSPPAPHSVAARPLRPTKAEFVQAFGAERRCPW